MRQCALLSLATSRCCTSNFTRVLCPAQKRSLWRDFKEYLNTAQQWLTTQDIPTFLSLRSLPSRALSSKLSPKRKGSMRSNLPNVPRLLRSLRTLTKASASQTGELKSLPLSTVRRSPRRRTGVSIHSSD